MRKIISVTAAALLLFSMPASADVAQVWNCTFNDEITDEDGNEVAPEDALMAISEAWLEKAKEIDENVSVTILRPVAADAEDNQYIWVFHMPSFAAWGAFTDAYPGSAVAEVDAGWDHVGPCNVSGLWATREL